MKMTSYVKKYLKLADLQEGLDRYIADVKAGSFDKPDLIFETGEILTLNVTNIITLARHYGDASEDWIGKKVEIYVGKTEYKGEMVDTILVKPITPGLTDAAKVEAAVAAAANNDMNDDIPF